MTEYEKKLQKATVKLAKANSEFKELLKECPHEVVITMEKYYEAGYDYVSETHTWNECTVCGERSQVTVVKGSLFN